MYDHGAILFLKVCDILLVNSTGPRVSFVGVMSIKILTYLIEMGLHLYTIFIRFLVTSPFHLKFQIYDPNVVYEILLWELFVIKFMKCSSENLNRDTNYLFGLDFSLNVTLVRKHIYYFSLSFGIC